MPWIYHELTVCRPYMNMDFHEDPDHIEGIISECENDQLAFGCPAKWDHRESDMKKYSNLFPSLIFRVECEHEGALAWVEYYKNGKMQRCEAKAKEIIFEDFDETKLK